MAIKKSLIVFDSNKVRNILAEGIRYDTFNFTQDFEELINFLNEQNLSDFVDVAIPEIVLGEILEQKLAQYNEDLMNFPKIKERIDLLPDSKIGEFVLPKEDFDCQSYLLPLVRKYLVEKNILVLKIDENKKNLILDSIINRAKKGDAPFKGKDNQKSKNQDAGFKDVVIWETIINWENIKDYHNLFLVTRDEGFKVNEEFHNKFPDKVFKIVLEVKYLIDDYLRDFYDNEKKLEYLESDDFASKLEDYMYEQFGLGINNFSVLKEEFILEEFSEKHVESYGGDDLSNQKEIKVISLSFLNDGKKYRSQVVFDFESNEIELGGYNLCK
ncbi:MAG: PIN domain-containing protein [Nanoarchaeota archaeon]|nr:PIN domain-containing protein [Nanoarchaeota archaeon]